MKKSLIINKYQKLTTYFIAAHILLYPIMGMVMDSPFLVPLVMQIILTFTAFLGSHTFKGRCFAADLSAMCLALSPAVLVYMLIDHPWQIDAHMYFFATLAMTTGFQSIRSILFASGVIAVHHLMLNFALPAALFPGDANFYRVVFHAVIVVLETAVLVTIIKNLNDMYASALEGRNVANEALAKAELSGKKLQESEENAATQRHAHAQSVANNYEGSIGGIIAAFSAETESLKDISEQISAQIEHSIKTTGSVNALTTETSQDVQAVVGAASELASSIHEIARNTQDALQSTNSCAETANQSKETLNELQSAVNEIDAVIQAISDVAEQTNLLALNATIEAARAGDAGKGFAVVASEVKLLASQTHKMTDEITNRINTIKSSASGTINSVEAILRGISEADSKTSSVAAAIQEQSAATDEINRSISNVAQGTEKISAQTILLSETARQSEAMKDALNSAAANIKNQSVSLEKSSADIVKDIRNS